MYFYLMEKTQEKQTEPNQLNFKLNKKLNKIGQDIIKTKPINLVHRLYLKICILGALIEKDLFH